MLLKRDLVLVYSKDGKSCRGGEAVGKYQAESGDGAACGNERLIENPGREGVGG
jgi:hypothetical protein